ncbi:ABC transporter ATP-binding protein [Cellulomonas sp. Y8]|uniref:ABC transporter ATP-binding protein n=1 Tax=Cellulomonas sp. Y8 TaxID=2591145 RepID=UPI003D755CA6
MTAILGAPTGAGARSGNHGGGTGSEPDPDRPGLRALAPYVRGHVGRLGLAAALALVCAALALTQPLLVNQMIGSVETSDGRLGPLSLGLLMVIIVTAVVGGWQQYLVGEVGEGVVRGARVRVARHLLRMPIAHVSAREPGELASRLTADTLLIRSAVSGGVVGLLGGGVTIVGSVVALVLIDPVTFLASAAVAGAAIVVTAIAARPVRRINVTVQQTTGDLSARIQRTLVGMRLIRAYDAHQAVLTEIDALIGDAYRHGVRLARLSAVVGPIASTLVSLALVVAIVVGGVRAASGGLGLAGLITFLMFFNMMVGPLNQLSAAVLLLQHAVAGHERITQVTSVPEEGDDDPPAASEGRARTNSLLTRATGPELRFENVTFTYEVGALAALDDVSFTAPPGRLTALVGTSGAGKTTALSGSLRDNLVLGALDVTDSVLVDALRTARLEGLLDRLGAGLDADLGPAAVSLSGGERQRLSIARALVRSPRLLLLDEPTASLDGQTEEAVLGVLDTLRPRATTVVIAHRLATVRHADKIVVLDRGRVVDEGTHSTLTQRCSLYRDLVRTQLS